MVTTTMPTPIWFQAERSLPEDSDGIFARK